MENGKILLFKNGCLGQKFAKKYYKRTKRTYSGLVKKEYDVLIQGDSHHMYNEIWNYVLKNVLVEIDGKLFSLFIEGKSLFAKPYQ